MPAVNSYVACINGMRVELNRSFVDNWLRPFVTAGNRSDPSDPILRQLAPLVTLLVGLRYGQHGVLNLNASQLLAMFMLTHEHHPTLHKESRKRSLFVEAFLAALFEVGEVLLEQVRSSHPPADRDCPVEDAEAFLRYAQFDVLHGLPGITVTALPVDRRDVGFGMAQRRKLDFVTQLTGNADALAAFEKIAKFDRMQLRKAGTARRLSALAALEACLRIIRQRLIEF